MNSATTQRILNAIAKVLGNTLSIVAGALAAIFLLFGGFALYDSLYIQQSAKGNWNALQYRPEIIDNPNARLSASELAAINSDYRAWITMYETNIDYPVMQANDDLYYVSHDIYKENSLSGAIYLAADNSPDFSDAYNILYGHHMDNGAMFGDLDKYAEKAFFDEHRTGVLVTETKVYDLYVFALVQTDAYEDAMYAVGNKDLTIVLTYAYAHALQYDTSVKIGSQIIGLSTCTSATTSGRLVLLATMTERSDVPVDPVNPVNPVNPDQPTNPDSPTNTDQPTSPTGTDNQDQPGGPNNPNQPSGPDQPTNPQSGEDVTPGTTPGTEPEVTPGTDTPDTPVPNDKPTTPDNPLDVLEPRVNEGGLNNWALLNLISTICTVYCFVPLGHLKAKFKRRSMLKDFVDALLENGAATPAAASGQPAAASGQPTLTPDEQSALERLLTRITRKYRAGLVLEALLAVGSVIFFVLVTDLRTPMVIINRYTPAFLALLFAACLVSRLLIRFCKRDKRKDEEEGAGAA